MGLVGVSLIGASIYLQANGHEQSEANTAAVADDSSRLQSLATLTPTPKRRETVVQRAEAIPTATPSPTPIATITPTPRQETDSPGLDNDSDPPESDIADVLVTDTLAITNIDPLTTEVHQAALTSTTSISKGGLSADIAFDSAEQVEEDVEYVEPYTSTAQVQPPPSAESTPEAEATPACPSTSEATFDLIPIEGQPMTNHPDFLHGDLNLSLRGAVPVAEPLELVPYNGNTDPDAPQLHGLFEPNRVPRLSSAYQVNDWIWDSGQCGGHPRGCPGPPIEAFWPVTLVGLATTPGEAIYTPERGSQIYRGGFIALVLYAEEQRITLGYTRRDNVVAGYTVHLENVCVNPTLLALYRAQRDEAGRHASGFLPALRNNQVLGTALGDEMGVAIRDAGSFMDPRSHKDWWR